MIFYGDLIVELEKLAGVLKAYTFADGLAIIRYGHQ